MLSYILSRNIPSKDLIRGIFVAGNFTNVKFVVINIRDFKKNGAVWRNFISYVANSEYTYPRNHQLTRNVPGAATGIPSTFIIIPLMCTL
jgi:hypothetical protein